MSQKVYAYVLLHGVLGSVIRAHYQYLGDPRDDPRALNNLLREGFLPVREIILPNSGVWVVLCKEEDSLLKKRKTASPRSAR